MKQQINKALMIGLCAFSTTIMASVNTELDAAHQAYLKGNAKEMVLHIRNVLMQDPSESVKKNALEMFQAAYQTFDGSEIAPDWKLPIEIRKMKITQTRSNSGSETNFHIKISGNTAQKNVIKKLSLIKYPEQIVLEKGKLGEWSEEIESNPEEGIYYGLESQQTDVPIMEGLYLIHLELNTGNKLDAWVILTDIVSSQVPKVTLPYANELLSTGTPTFRFEDFKSPEYKSYEKRSAWFGVIKMTPPDYKWDEIYTLWTANLPKTQLTVGSEVGGIGASSLHTGKYRLYVSFKEERKFGDLRIGRQSGVSVPFSVLSGRKSDVTIPYTIK